MMTSPNNDRPEAAERGPRRASAYLEIALLRGVLEEFFAEDDIPRDTLAPGAERYGHGASVAQPIDPGATTAVRGRGRSAEGYVNGGRRHA